MVSPARLFDYLSSQGELRLRSPDRERRWQLALDALVQADSMDQLDVELLKSVAVVAVLDPVPGLRTDAESMAWCLGVDQAQIEAALARLAARRILYRRPHRNDHSLWSNTSVDLDHWIEEARVRVPSVTRIDTIAGRLPPARPIVAHRHYHRSGTLRTFSVTMSDAERDSDGAIIVLPVHPDQDENEALADAGGGRARPRRSPCSASSGLRRPT